ncbi:MAG: 2-keto-4-pentenoate hydratase [Halodesulfurarchaeum sp.]
MPDLDDLGRRLAAAYRSGTRIEAPSAEYDLSVEDAYRIQSAFIEDRTERGSSPVGYKLGFTNETVQDQYGVDEPAYGVLLDDTVLTEGTVSVSDLIDPRIEPEIAFVLSRPLSGQVAPYEVLASTRAIVPVIEIVDCRIDGHLDAVDAIADNALASKLVPGSTITDPTANDVAMESVQVRIGGDPVESGTGTNVLDHPARAVSWLAGTLSEQGEPIADGEIVSTGSLTSAISVEPGDVVEARFGSLGSVTIGVTQ